MSGYKKKILSLSFLLLIFKNKIEYLKTKENNCKYNQTDYSKKKD